MKKRAVAFTIADGNNLAWAKMMIASLRKFHSEEELPVFIYSPEPTALARDPHFFYRATPNFAKDLIKEYDLVIKMDADMIITGDLNHILNDESYDVGGVLNWNRVDPTLYGLVQVWDIKPDKYLNCGLVAMRSEEFINHWWALCNSDHFLTYQYREQDLLNILAWYGNYKVQVFDWQDTWNGLISKGEWPRAQLVGDDIVVYPEIQLDGTKFPEITKKLKVLHWAGGNANPEKMNYRLGFNDDIIKRIDYLVKEVKHEQSKS
jgi:hypothetical protein